MTHCLELSASTFHKPLITLFWFLSDKVCGAFVYIRWIFRRFIILSENTFGMGCPLSWYISFCKGICRVLVGIKPWFLTTTLWRLRKRDAVCTSQSCGFEGGWFLRVALISVPPWPCADAAASCGCGIRSLTSAWRRRSLVTTGRKSCWLFTAVVFLCTMSCKEEFDAKGRRECAGLSERNRGRK